MRRFILSIALLLSLTQFAHAADALYEGTWRTTNRKLDGPMTCAVKDLGDNKWAGRFYGIWQGVPFDYTVAFAGPPDKLTGKAQIDGADYIWTGDLGSADGERFTGNFGGNRYTGYFDLKRKQTTIAGARTPVLR